MFGFRKKYTREIAHFVQLSGKLGRRLGVARSRARQAESEAAFWKERAQAAAQNALTFKANQEQLEVELKQYKRAVQRRLEEAADSDQAIGYNIPINTRPGV